MTLASKDGTYNKAAFDKQWWNVDHRFGFDPPEGLLLFVTMLLGSTTILVITMFSVMHLCINTLYSHKHALFV